MSERTLLLMRHAKAERAPELPDRERPLAPRGIEDARAAGRWLAETGPAPDVVLCSAAVRTRRTWELVAPALQRGPGLLVVPELYGGGVSQLVDLLHRLDPAVGVALVVGHEPTLSTAALALAGPGSDPQTVEDVAVKFPTSGIAVLGLEGEWRRCRPGQAVLQRFVVPRG